MSASGVLLFLSIMLAVIPFVVLREVANALPITPFPIIVSFIVFF